MSFSPPARKVLIAIPAYSGEVGAPTMIGVIRAIEEARSVGIDVQVTIRSHDSLLPRCRNALLSEFMAGNASDLVFWDADLAAEPGAFVRLIGHDADVVGGAYRTRSDPERYIFRALPGKDLTREPSGLVEVEALGTGFLRITRAAIERMVSADDEAFVIEPSGSRLLWLFDFERSGDHQYFSEDFVFCRRFRACGGRVFLDPDIAFHHTVPKTFSGRYAVHAGLARGPTHEILTDAAVDAASAALDRFLADGTLPF